MPLAEARSVLEGLLGALPGRRGRLLRRLYYRARFAACGPTLSIGEHAEIACPENVHLGDRIYLDRGFVLRACEGGRIAIGDDFGANGNVRLIADCGGRITIGDKVIVGPNVVIRAADHSFARTDTPIREQGHAAGEIVIGSDVWIAANVVVVQGARIGAHAVIGAGSVVTGEIPAFAVAAGAPARVLRMRNQADRTPGTE
ncbi:MAG: acyltransferase [Pseudomonadota bacterium]